jgi:hypothetical protein
MINFTKIYVLFCIFIILFCLIQSSITNIYVNEHFQENNNPILFMHFHKAGGTTINSMANKMKKFTQNKNGNPYMNNELIRFWEYKNTEFENFKKYIKTNQIEFLCMEWGHFKYFNDINTSDITLITCFRDPYERYISNINYDKSNNSQKYTSNNIKYDGVYVNFNKMNYYVRMLCGLYDELDVEMTEEHLEKAKRVLDRYDAILILENPDSFKLIEKYKFNNVSKKNKTSSKNYNIGITKNEFVNQNKLDYELYNYAKYLSDNQLKR